jgi:hypothetical protein
MVLSADRQCSFRGEKYDQEITQKETTEKLYTLETWFVAGVLIVNTLH